jgi:hypothetical protein
MVSLKPAHPSRLVYRVSTERVHAACEATDQKQLKYRSGRYRITNDRDHR